MFRKSAMLALTAFAALGLAISSASAMPIKPGFGPKKPGFNPGIMKPFPKPIKPGFTPIKPIKWPGLKPHWPHHHHHHHRHVRIWYPPVAVAAPTYIASRPVAAAPGPCTCLSKEYTQEGAVVFKDRCTNEMAMNPPPAPQQTGAVEQQQQTVQYSQQYVQPQPQPQAK